jgi:hypothetical protein
MNQKYFALTFLVISLLVNLSAQADDVVFGQPVVDEESAYSSQAWTRLGSQVITSSGEHVLTYETPVVCFSQIVIHAFATNQIPKRGFFVDQLSYVDQRGEEVAMPLTTSFDVIPFARVIQLNKKVCAREVIVDAVNSIASVVPRIYLSVSLK